MELSRVLESYIIFDDEYYDLEYVDEGLKSFIGGIGKRIANGFKRALNAVKGLKDRIAKYIKERLPKTRLNNTRENRTILVYINKTKAVARELANALKSSNSENISNINDKIDDLEDVADKVNDSTKRGLISEGHAKDILSELTGLEGEIKKILTSLESTSAAMANMGMSSGTDNVMVVCRKILPHISNVIKFIGRSVSFSANAD